MPELPEVEHLRRCLAPLVGRRVTRATLHRRDVLRAENGSRDGAVSGQELLSGAVITDLERRGKQLAIHSDRRSLLVHLGMSGGLTIVPAGVRTSRRTHVHVTWCLDDGSRLVFRDPRRFGGLWAYQCAESLRRARWDDLGPDALSISARLLRPALARSRRPIKAALLDQALLAGVGNIYADEALFASGIHPLTPASDVEAVAVLARHIRAILSRAIDEGGSTIRDYRDAAGRNGEFQLIHAVYGRAGQPCTTCGTSLHSTRVAQRQTVFCPQCQPAYVKGNVKVEFSLRKDSLEKRGKAQSSS